MNPRDVVLETTAVVHDSSALTINVGVRGCTCGIQAMFPPRWHVDKSPTLATVALIGTLGAISRDVFQRHIDRHAPGTTLTDRQRDVFAMRACIEQAKVLAVAIDGNLGAPDVEAVLCESLRALARFAEKVVALHADVLS